MFCLTRPISDWFDKERLSWNSILFVSHQSKIFLPAPKPEFCSIQPNACSSQLHRLRSLPQLTRQISQSLDAIVNPPRSRKQWTLRQVAIRSPLELACVDVRTSIDRYAGIGILSGDFCCVGIEFVFRINDIGDQTSWSGASTCSARRIRSDASARSAAAQQLDDDEVVEEDAPVASLSRCAFQGPSDLFST